MVLQEFYPGNLRYALPSQGQRRPPVSHLYQDCLHTFVIKGSVQWKAFFIYMDGSSQPFVIFGSKFQVEKLPLLHMS